MSVCFLHQPVLEKKTWGLSNADAIYGLQNADATRPSIGWIRKHWLNPTSGFFFVISTSTIGLLRKIVFLPFHQLFDATTTSSSFSNFSHFLFMLMFVVVRIEGNESQQFPADADEAARRAALRSSSCCTQSWTLSVINWRRSSIELSWQHLRRSTRKCCKSRVNFWLLCSGSEVYRSLCSGLNNSVILANCHICIRRNLGQLYVTVSRLSTGKVNLRCIGVHAQAVSYTHLTLPTILRV